MALKALYVVITLRINLEYALTHSNLHAKDLKLSFVSHEVGIPRVCTVVKECQCHLSIHDNKLFLLQSLNSKDNQFLRGCLISKEKLSHLFLFYLSFLMDRFFQT